MQFKNIKTLDAHYKHPMSYRIGTIYNDNGIVRVYSNGNNIDYEKGTFFYYKLKNTNVESRFRDAKKKGLAFRLVTKKDNGVTDRGLYKVSGLIKALSINSLQVSHFFNF